MGFEFFKGKQGAIEQIVHCGLRVPPENSKDANLSAFYFLGIFAP